MSVAKNVKTFINEDEESKAEMVSFRPKPKGRPKYNIFVERADLMGDIGTPPFSPRIRHIILECKRKDWLDRFSKPREEVTARRWTNRHFAWSRVIHAWGESYIPFKHAELVMLLCGRYAPEKRFNEKGQIRHSPSLYDQFFLFRSFCDEVNERRSAHLRIWDKRGQKPNPEKIYRTAVSTLAARRFLLPSGGDKYFIPSDQAIAQAWEIIFGDQESVDAIRKRMPTVAWYCVNSAKFGKLICDRRYHRFGMLGQSLRRKYPELLQ